MLKKCIDDLKMHSECVIIFWCKVLKIFRGRPQTPTCRRGWPPPPPSPFQRYAPQWIRLHWTLVPRPPAVEVLDPLLFYEYNCRCILNYWNDYGMFIFYNGSSLEMHQLFSSKQTHITTKQDNYSQRAWYLYLLDHTKIVSGAPK